MTTGIKPSLSIELSSVVAKIELATGLKGSVEEIQDGYWVEVIFAGTVPATGLAKAEDINFSVSFSHRNGFWNPIQVDIEQDSNVHQTLILRMIRSILK